MPAGNGVLNSEPPEVYVRATAARRQSAALAARLRTAQRDSMQILQSMHAAFDRAQQIHELWLMSHPDADPLRYSAHARLQARMKSMPVIEQAKGIIMAQFGWPEDQAFDALRRASMRENVKLRDLAARIVANTARSAAGRDQPEAAHVTPQAREELTLA
jgi:hypothetical protein